MVGTSNWVPETAIDKNKQDFTRQNWTQRRISTARIELLKNDPTGKPSELSGVDFKSSARFFCLVTLSWPQNQDKPVKGLTLRAKLVGGLVVWTPPLWKMMEFVNWEMTWPQVIWENKIHGNQTTKHVIDGITSTSKPVVICVQAI